MEYTFNNVDEILDTKRLHGQVCLVEEKPLPMLQFVFDEMKKEYIRARNITTDMYISDYNEEEGKKIMNDRYPKPVNIDELANQAKIIANKYEICGTTIMSRRPGFIVKIPNVRVRVRTYCNLGDYYCWIQKYGIDKFELRVYLAMPNEEGYLIFGGGSYPHPHISNDSPCLGSFEAPIRNCAGHFNMVGILSNINKYLNSYYGRSVFLKVNEFRPQLLNTLPIDLLKEFEGVSINFDSYRYKHPLQPKYNTSDYHKLADEYNDKYGKNIETVELKPHESNFYIKVYDCHDLNASFGHIVQKVRLLMEKFNSDNYYQMYSLFIVHGKGIGGIPIKWGKKYAEHENAWYTISNLCLDYQESAYRIGYGRGGNILPDIKLDDTGLISLASKLRRLIHPSPNDALYRIADMPCVDFWKYIDNFKDIQEFLIPQDDYDERKDKVLKQIDEIYPELMEWSDSYKRKIIITLDKQKRRLQNGLKHTLPTPTSNQLSFEALSQD